MTDDDDLDWRVCVHEAGHVLTARLLRLPDCGSATAVRPHAGAYYGDDDGGPKGIAATMAGACAEQLIFGDYDRVGVTVDRAKWTKRLEAAGVTDGGAALWSFTVDLLRQHRTALLALARKLHRAQARGAGVKAAALDRFVDKRAVPWGWQPPERHSPTDAWRERRQRLGLRRRRSR